MQQAVLLSLLATSSAFQLGGSRKASSGLRMSADPWFPNSVATTDVKFASLK